MKHDPSSLGRRGVRALTSGSGFIAAALMCASTSMAAADSPVASLDDRRNADRWLVVDCLLPGQVRQLGTGITYLAPRRGIKTDASDCAIRGGEYVASDRANYATALKVWLPSADAGDKVAQTYVGEIYERGLGTAPDYAKAAVWYKKAADQGYTRAYINLGFLYEQGLGVSKDPAMALNLYRKAAGIEGSVNLDGAPPAASKEELDALRKELDRARQDLEKARRELDQQRLKSSQEIERLTQKKLEAAAAGNAEETRRLEAQLRERESELENRRQQVARFERVNEDYKARLSRLESESATLRLELEQAQRQLTQSQRDIEDKKSTLAEAERRLVAMQQELSRQKSAVSPPDPGRIKALEAELERNRVEFTRQRQEITRLELDVTGYKEKVAKLDGAPPAASKEEFDALRKELEKARRELDEQRVKSRQETERLTQKKLEAAAAGNAEETRRLEAQLKERESELENRRQQVARFERMNEDYKARLSRLESESVALRQELEQAQRQLAQSQRDVEDKKGAAAEAERRLSAMQQELARQKSAVSPPDPGRIKAMEAELEKTRAEFGRQRQEITRLEADVTGYKEKVAKLETTREPAKQTVSMAPPSIQIIDPQVVITRDTATVTVRSGVATRSVVGRVTAPAGLLSFTANDVLQELDADGIFKTTANLGGGKTRMTMVAVDRQGNRTSLEFFMQPETATAVAVAAPTSKMSGQDLGLGKYYALVIGNQDYTKLPRLKTPEADASVIAGLLKDRYGFNVTVMLNATRLQMLDELNKLQKILTEKDNLLIYYAGHGEYDRVNSLANWLPIDAEPDNDSNWIQSSRLTEKLNTFQAKHILVVADSCYSGAMTRSSIGAVQPGLTDEARFVWLKAIAASPSRTVLTSGGVSPVMDGGGGKHSIFAQNFIDVLSENRDILPGKQLSDVLAARVVSIARRLNFEQRPEYAPIRFAGGESGDFLFVPTKI